MPPLGEIRPSPIQSAAIPLGSLISNRTLSGTPTATGTHTVTVTVEDADGDTDSDSFVLTVGAAADLMPTAGNTTNKSYTVDTDFSFTLAAGSGGDGTLSLTVAGLPTGATFDGTDTISGNVNTAGAHTITVTYTDDDGDTDDRHFRSYPHKHIDRRNHIPI